MTPGSFGAFAQEFDPIGRKAKSKSDARRVTVLHPGVPARLVVTQAIRDSDLPYYFDSQL